MLPLSRFKCFRMFTLELIFNNYHLHNIFPNISLCTNISPTTDMNRSHLTFSSLYLLWSTKMFQDFGLQICIHLFFYLQDLDTETLAHIDAENRRQTLEEELEFLKQVHEQVHNSTFRFDVLVKTSVKLFDYNIILACKFLVVIS